MTFHLEPVPGGLFDNGEWNALDREVVRDVLLLSGDSAIIQHSAGFSLRADVLVVAEETDAR